MAKSSKKIMSVGGIGESKNFGAPESERPVTGADRILECHIDGAKVSDMGLSQQVLVALDYWMTDEGIAQREANPNARPSSGIELTKEPFDKALQERRDDVKLRDRMLFDSRDPLKEVADQFAQPGMRPKFLSARRLHENGGTGNYEVVKKPNGDPVTVKGMVLGHTPIELAEARNEHFRAIGNAKLKQIGETYKQEGGATAVVDQ